MSEHVAQVCYTDNCCGDRKFLQETLGPASVFVEDAAHSTCFADGESEELPPLDFPDGFKANLVVVTRENCEVSARACLELLRRTRASGMAVLGFDIQWSARATGPCRPPATLQLSAPDGYTVVFQLKRHERKDGILPAATKELLINNTVKLVSLFWCATCRRGLCCSSVPQSSALANIPVYPRLCLCSYFGCRCFSGWCFSEGGSHARFQQLRCARYTGIGCGPAGRAASRCHGWGALAPGSDSDVASATTPQGSSANEQLGDFSE